MLACVLLPLTNTLRVRSTRSTQVGDDTMGHALDLMRLCFVSEGVLIICLSSSKFFTHNLTAKYGYIVDASLCTVTSGRLMLNSCGRQSSLV